jgi:hypothetical protein
VNVNFGPLPGLRLILESDAQPVNILVYEPLVVIAALLKFISGICCSDEQPLNILLNAVVPVTAVVSNAGIEPILVQPLNILPNVVTLTVLKSGTI